MLKLGHKSFQLHHNYLGLKILEFGEEEEERWNPSTQQQQCSPESRLKFIKEWWSEKAFLNVVRVGNRGSAWRGGKVERCGKLGMSRVEMIRSGQGDKQYAQ